MEKNLKLKELIQKEKKNKEEKEDKINKKRILAILLLLFCSFTFFTFSLGLDGGLIDSIQENIIYTIFSKPTAPEITGGSKEWAKKRTIKVVKDAKTKNGIDYYQYCVASKKTTKDCDWKRTNTKNAIITHNGIRYIYFRAVDKDGNKGFESDYEVTYIDNNPPTITDIEVVDVTKTTLKLKTTAKDYESGMGNYFYGINSDNLIGSKNVYEFTNLTPNTEYTIYIKVTDKLGNEKIVSRVYKTLSEEETETPTEETLDKLVAPTYEVLPSRKGWSTYKTVIIHYPEGKNLIREYTIDEGKTWLKYTGPVTFYKNGIIQARVSNKKETVKADPLPIMFIDNEIPTISLDGVPSEFEYTESYDLPTSYTFGPSGGTVVCTVDGQKQVNTSILKIGKHKIICTATSKAGISVTETKDITVTYITGDDEVMDGWLRLNLNYPEKSTDRKWAIIRPNTVTDGTNNATWQEYIGPILIRLEDVEYVYTSYVLNGERVTVSPIGTPLVVVTPNAFKLYDGEKTKVTIEYDKEAETKQYKVNDSAWKDYTGPIEVGPNTVVTGKVTVKKDVYDQDGKKVTTRTVTNTHAAAIVLNNYRSSGGNRDPWINDLYAEVVASRDDFGICSGNKGIGFDFDGSGYKEIKINDEPWQDYTGQRFSLPIGTRIMARITGYPREGASLRTVYARTRYVYRKCSSGDTPDSDELMTNINAPKSLTIGTSSKISIYYTSFADVKVYRVNYGEWKDYKELITVYPGDVIESRIQHPGYRDQYDIVKIKKTIPVPAIYAEAPIIDLNPRTELSESVEVIITPPEEAYKTYYRFQGSSWKEYTAPFSVTENGKVQAKYIRKADGVTSKVATDYVKNIKPAGELPYIRIDTEPVKIEDENLPESVMVSLVGENYNTIEYSLDGVIYNDYIEPIKITKTCIVYAKATNATGVSSTFLPITVKGPDGDPKPPEEKEKVDIEIIASPEKEEVTKLVRSVEITINYDKTAEDKYYKINEGEWKKYDGTFVIDENSTIYAYSTSETTKGEGKKIIDYLTNGLASPVIESEPENNIESTITDVDITYDKTSTLKLYSVDNSALQVYDGTFGVTKNCTISAISRNSLGQISTSTYAITNINPPAPTPGPKTDTYFLLKLNYPTTSKEASRQYKFLNKTENWVKYPSDGILLIRSGKEAEVFNSKDEIWLLDDNGNEYLFKGDHYIVTEDFDDITGDIVMKWDSSKIEKPIITPDKDNNTWTDEVEININYSKESLKNEYKLIKSDGTSTEWLDYEEPITITENGTIIYARALGTYSTYSDVESYVVNNIDNGDPYVKSFKVIDRDMYTLTVNAEGKDDGIGIAKYYYSLDKENWVESLEDNYTFTGLKMVTEYTMYVKAEDVMGYSTPIYSVKGKTTSITAPKMSVTKQNEWYYEKTLTIYFVPGEFTKEYSIDAGKTWIPYTGPITFTENTNVIARIYDDKLMASSSITINRIDGSLPIIDKITVVPKSSRISINVDSAYDKESGIGRYYYSYDGVNYTNTKEKNHVFKQLTSDLDYTIYVKVLNNAGAFSEVYTVDTRTNDITVPVYTMEPDADTWGYTKDITITYPYKDEDCYYQYSTDGGATWSWYNKPIHIAYEGATVIARVVSGPNIVMASSLSITKVDRTQPTITLQGLPNSIGSGDSHVLPIGYTLSEDKSGGSTYCTSDIYQEKITNTSELRVGTHTITCTVTTGVGQKATTSKKLTVYPSLTFDVDSIYQGIIKEKLVDGEYLFRVKNGDETVNYTVELYNFDENVEYTTTPTLCDSTYDSKMCILIYKGNLTIGSGVTITPQVRKKGFTIYVAGTLTNNGTISMSARGAKAEGQNVYLWRNTNGTYEYVPATGGTGGAAVGGYDVAIAGNAGAPGIQRSTGGGGAGAVYTRGCGSSKPTSGASGAGSAGTSYSGGSGGGSAVGNSGYVAAGAGGANGGAGGAGRSSRYNCGNYESGGGAGNPGGSGSNYGNTGTGGLLNIFATNMINNGNLTSNGTTGGYGYYSRYSASPNWNGGSSGGGSINVFYKDKLAIGTLSTTGGVYAHGGAGGTGSATISQIIDGSVLGHEYNPYIISTKEDLINMSNLGRFSANSYYKIVNDIDISSIDSWTPIGDATYPFIGNVDFGNHTITGLTVNTTASNQGLFGNIQNSTIKNLKLENVNIVGGGNVGGLIGNAAGNNNIENITVTGTVRGTGTNVGGLIGYINANVTGTTISDCVSNVNTTGAAQTGGLVGYLYLTSDSININNVISTGTVNGAAQTGGLIGYSQSTKGTNTLTNAYATGNITATGNNAGGLIGYLVGVNKDDSKVTNAYATGNVTGISYMGGLIGQATNSTINDTYSTGTITGTDYAGSLIGTVTNIDINNSYAIGRLTTTGTNTGGLVGVATNSTATNSYFSSQTTGLYRTALGLNVRLEKLFSKNKAYLDWDFENTWDIEENSSTAYLKGTTKPATVDKVNYPYNEIEGKGTEDEPYLIYDLEDLDDVNSELYSNYKLMNDLDMTSSNIIIGEMKAPFTGVFDGNNHTIDGLTINKTTNYNGLFTYIKNATIKNLNLTNVNITGASYTGSLVGQAEGRNNITNIDVTGTINTTGAYVGGLIGYNTNTTEDEEIISNITTNVTITGNTASTHVGGLIGYNHLNSIGTITIDEIETNTPITGKQYLGGLIGYNYNQLAGTINISNISTTGDVTGTGPQNGGLIGINHNLSTGTVNISSSNATGNVRGTSEQGGLIGYIYNVSTGKNIIKDVYATGNVNGTLQVGGLIGYSYGAVLGTNTLENAYSTGIVTATGNNSGGLIGWLRAVNGSTTTINKAYSVSNVAGTNYSAGLIGQVNFANINDVYSTGTVTGTDYIGSLIGTINNSEISNAYAVGKLTVTGENTGGLVGTATSTTATNSYFSSQTTGLIRTAVGINLRVPKLLSVSTSYTDWDFENTWDIEEGLTLAYLKGLPKPTTVNKDNLVYDEITGEGTEESPYLIHNLAELNDMRNELGAHYKLVNDIEIPTETLFVPIGELRAPFSGVFDGNNHTISGININKTTYVGMFGVTKGATIKNLTLENLVVKGTTYVGGLIGYNTDSLNVTNVTINGNVTGTGYVGGLVGYTNTTTATTNTFDTINITGNVTSTGGYNGGLIGDYITNNIDADSTFNNININATIKGTTYTAGLLGYTVNTMASDVTLTNITLAGTLTTGGESGGFLGYFDNHSGGTITIDEIHSSSSITGNAAQLGGLIGELYNTSAGTITMDHMTSTGNVTQTGNVTSTGGLIGLINNRSTGVIKLDNSSSSGIVIGKAYTGGIIGYIYNDTGGQVLVNEVSTTSTITGTAQVAGIVGYSYNNGAGILEIKNSEVTTGTITATANDVGGIVGQQYNNGTGITRFINLTNEVPVKGVSQVGGIIGYLYEYNANQYISDTLVATNNVTATGNNVGGLIGYVYNRTTGVNTITNSYSTGNVSGVAQVGGLIGYNQSSGATTMTISKTYATGDVTGTNNNTGGLIGYLNGTTVAKNILEKSYSTGTVTGPNYVGGLVGQLYNATVNDSYTTSEVNNTTNYAGGLSGYATGSKLLNVYAVGKVTTPGVNTGGLIGVASNSTATNSYFSSETVGLIRTAVGENRKIKSLTSKSLSYTDWDFEETWDIEEGTTLAYLKGLPKSDKTNLSNYSYITYDGLGTVEDPYQITTYEQLINVRHGLNDNYILMNDIEIPEGETIETLSELSAPFTGTFNGNGFTINNVKINNTLLYGGLFGATKDATIKDLTLTNVDINGSLKTGGLIGYASGNTTITNVGVNGTIVGNGTETGGLIGTLYGTANITGGTSNVTVTGKGNQTGGLIGYAYRDAEGDITIKDTNVTANVTSTGSYVGGLVGYTHNLVDGIITIDNVTTSGTVSGANQIGGIVGYALNVKNGIVKVINSNSSVNVTGTANDVAGAVGQLSNSATGNMIVQNVHTTGTANGKVSSAGLVGYLYNNATGTIEVSESSATGNITSTANQIGGLIAIAYNNSTGTINMEENSAEGIVKGTSEVGGLIGYIYNKMTGSVTLIDSYATGNVEGTTHIGGLVGYNYQVAKGSNAISKCYATGNVTGTGNYVGGFIGLAQAVTGSTTTIDKTYATGTVTGPTYVGGYIGQATYNVITDSFSTGETTGTNYASSFIGYSTYSTIMNAYTTGKLVSTGANIGSLVGASVSSNAYNSYFTSETTRTIKTALGINVRVVKMLSEYTNYVDWDFDTIWTIEEGKTFAYLRNMTKPDSVDSQTMIYSDIQGLGTEENPYIIKNVGDLQGITFDLSKNYILGNDIVVPSTYEYMPVGDSTNPFTGVLNGNGYKIDNLKINNVFSDTGLFAATKNATIKDLTLTDVNITGTSDVGSLIGYAIDGNIISNINVTGIIKGTADNVGGLIGYANNTSENNLMITNCSADVVVNGNSQVGGLIGYIYNTSFGSNLISNAYTNGSVTGIGNNVGGLVGYSNSNIDGETTISKTYSSTYTQGNSYVGGLIGQTNYSNILNSYSIWQLSANSYGGGLIGRSNNTTIENSYTTVKITSNATTGIGGMVGTSNNSTSINSYYTSEINIVKISALGIDHSIEDSKLQTNYISWDFENIWSIEENEKPYLKNIIKPDDSKYETSKNFASINDFIKNTNLSGNYTLNVTVGDETERYETELYVFNSMTYTKTPTLCDNTYDLKMCIIKYNGNLTINNDVTLTPQTRKKGFYVYVEGNLTNNGTISMTARGAVAEGQNVYLYKNNDDTYEYVPAIGAIGGASVNSNNIHSGGLPGNAGSNGVNRRSGGGGSGATWHWIDAGGYSGAGGSGTSYSGGAGGGGSDTRSWSPASGAGSSTGGAGGIAYANYSSGHRAGGGAGNPGGAYSSKEGAYGAYGSTGTGGLLIVTSKSLINNGTISSNGALGGNIDQASGGSSGGGSINVFYIDEYENNGSIAATGPKMRTGGKGGDGSVTVGSISTGTFVAN